MMRTCFVPRRPSQMKRTTKSLAKLGLWVSLRFGVVRTLRYPCTITRWRVDQRRVSFVLHLIPRSLSVSLALLMLLPLLLLSFLQLPLQPLLPLPTPPPPSPSPPRQPSPSFPQLVYADVFEFVPVHHDQISFGFKDASTRACARDRMIYYEAQQHRRASLF